MITMTPNPDAPVSAPKTEQKAKRAAKKALEERAAKKALEEVKQQLEAPQDVWDRLIKAQEQQILGVLQEGAMEVAGQAHPKLRVMTGEEINAAYLALLNIASFAAEAIAANAAGYATLEKFEAAQKRLGKWGCM